MIMVSGLFCYAICFVTIQKNNFMPGFFFPFFNIANDVLDVILELSRERFTIFAYFRHNRVFKHNTAS